MKKKLIVSLAVLLLIFTCVAISAADLETVDEGNYTISVPADVTFKDVGILPAGVSIYFSSSGFMDSIENAMIDGIRFHIRESEQIKKEVKKYLSNIKITGEVKPLDVLESILDNLGYNSSQLIISDEHELLEIISKFNFR